MSVILSRGDNRVGGVSSDAVLRREYAKRMTAPGQAVLRRHGAGQSLTAQVQALFGKYSAAGGMWDFTDASTLRQNSGGTGAVGDGDTIGWAADISGNGNTLIQETLAGMPLWDEDDGAVFDGVNDTMVRSGTSFPVTPSRGALFAFSGSRNYHSTYTGFRIGLGALLSGSRVASVGGFVSTTNSQATASFRDDINYAAGGATTSLGNSSWPGGQTDYHAGWYDGTSVFRQLGDTVSYIAATGGTFDFTATSLVLNDALVPGTYKRAIAINRALNSDERAIVRAWLMEVA